MVNSIEMRDIVKIYDTKDKTNTISLRGIDFNIPVNSLSTIIGPSGAGKSTLINLLFGVIKQSAGTITILEQDLSKLNIQQHDEFMRENIAIVLQNPTNHLSPEITFLQQLEISLIFNKVQNKISIESVVNDLQVSHLLNRRVKHLSMGEKTKLVLAMTLIKSPKIILLDEPTGMLDNESTKIIIDILKNLTNKGITILTVTHDSRFIVESDVIFLIFDGRLTSIQTKREINSIYNQMLFVDKSGFVQIPLYIRAILNIENEVNISYSKNDKFAKLLSNTEITQVSINELREISKYFNIRESKFNLLRLQCDRFPDNGPVILKDINIEFSNEDITFIIGPSGSGKSSILALCAGELINYKGKTFLSDQLIEKNNWKSRLTEKIVYIPHNPIFHPELPMRMQLRLLASTDLYQIIESLLEYFELKDKGDSLPNELSRGQIQRMSIIQAILQGPKFILFDEPSSNVHEALKIKIKELISLYHKMTKVGIIIATHDPFLLIEGARLLKIDKNRKILNDVIITKGLIDTEKNLFVQR